MITRLLAALADGAGDGGGGGEDTGPRPGVGAEEIADILWLAARVDPAGSRPPPPASGGADAGRPPADDPQAPGTDAVHGGRADGQPAAKLFPAPVPGPAGKPADDGAGRRGAAVRLPRAASLDDPLALMRALRPVGRRSIGGPGEELDEQLTVERSIERMVPTPVLRPAESRWLDLALVVDTHHSMLLWADLVDELRRVLTRSGVFRDVRTWQLTGTGSGGTPMLTRGRYGAPRNPLELADPAGRRLILVLSDTVAGGWREASVQGVLRHWGAHNAVAVLNVLPERLWTRGAVRPVPFAVRADRPAAATRSWQRAATARRSRPRAGRPRTADVVPVVGVAPGSLARLARLVSGDGRWRRLACLRLDAEPGDPPAREAPAGPVRGALEVVERFRANASPTAQQLAAHLAAVPLTLPVMNLVRRSLLKDSEHGHLAEVALGGLFEPWGHERDPEQVEFAFRPGVREALLGSQLRGDVAAVRELVRRRVWEYMSRNRGTGPDFSATRVTDGREGRRRVAEEALPFATQPPRDPGLADRVVRVRYHGLPEPLEVGTLLTPRLVLTVGDVAPGAIGWVRAGEREISCQAVWWDDALPRVFLLLADEDLAGPQPGPEPQPWLTADPPPGRVRIDGRTDQGDAVALTGEVVPYEGARNGELVRLSAEPEAWTHYRGGPVSRDGALIGVVHGVWPDRMVFLSGRALLEQPGFRAAMAEHGPTVPPQEGGPWAVCLALRSAADVAHPAGRLLHAEAVELLMRVIADTGLTERPAGSEPGAPLFMLLDEPGALARAGRLLTGLHTALAASRPTDAGPLSLDVAVAAGHLAVPAGGDITGLPTSEAARLLRHPEMAEGRRLRPGPLAAAVSRTVYEALGEKVGPTATRTLTPLGGGGWLSADPGELGAALTDADGRQDTGAGWPVCGRRAVDDVRAACTGVRLPGHDVCLAHLEPHEEHVYLGTLGPGSRVDFRGTTFREGLLQRLLDALRESRGRPVTLGEAAFDRATFVDDWNEGGIEFLAGASFTRAVFAGRARLGNSAFAGRVSFDRAVFLGVGDFDRSRFHAGADFRRAQFHGLAGFSDSVFQDEVSFARAVLDASADLNGIRVAGAADFSRAVFHGLTGLSGASFAGPVSFASTTWETGLVSTGAVFEEPVDFGGAVFRGRVRLEQLRLPGAPGPAFEDRTGRWGVHRRPDDTWDIHLLATGSQ